ncbi:PEP-CTERM sorting domain-containing protein [Limnofasciculus baicalensis]|uniref:PEP-CTERM sorting domain-containing protein n=1 Tax=Limnofasciculus baicalensis BBK-W-15 TaxID=2699891 RepID=A0AAE3KNC0_9CYAN|nr:PEP-CTERM sorting domain-containing protein [Limnofasciculus baicalensis]MCP2728488.1 PEP-CTERM sorting domain-containing protein [Limnofasciculus baicalensis BBK-W-15]
MKNILSKLAATAVTYAILSVASTQEAQAISFNFDWQGDGGYSAKGMFSYDETTAPVIISESGPGSTNNLQSLMVSFFDPSNNPLQSFNTVSNGVSESGFLEFNFDTSTQTLFGGFDVGGGQGIIGEQFLNGTVGSFLQLRQDVDQMGPKTEIELDRNSGAITVTAKSVPEPTSILGLLALGAMGAGSILKKKQA